MSGFDVPGGEGEVKEAACTFCSHQYRSLQRNGILSMVGETSDRCRPSGMSYAGARHGASELEPTWIQNAA